MIPLAVFLIIVVFLIVMVVLRPRRTIFTASRFIALALVATSFCCLCYGFYAAFSLKWVIAGTCFLATIASLLSGRYLWVFVANRLRA